MIERLLVTVNFAPNQSQCYVRLSFDDLGNGRWRLEGISSATLRTCAKGMTCASAAFTSICRRGERTFSH